MDLDRSQRFQRFVRQHVSAFAEIAQYGFSTRGKGAVFLIVDALEGGDEFRPQPSLNLSYTPEGDLKRDEIVADMIGRSDFPAEAVIVAVYRDGTRDVTRVAIQQMRQAAGGQPGSVP